MCPRVLEVIVGDGVHSSPPMDLDGVILHRLPQSPPVPLMSSLDTPFGSSLPARLLLLSTA
jgi:hypothetical protein